MIIPSLQAISGKAFKFMAQVPCNDISKVSFRCPSMKVIGVRIGMYLVCKIYSKNKQIFGECLMTLLIFMVIAQREI